jgi:sugar lactone lactonase YvrE
MRALFLALALARLPGAASSTAKAMLLSSIPAFEAETLLTEQTAYPLRMGCAGRAAPCTSPTKGGSAVRCLKDGKLATLADARSGLKSPEDLARGADGTLYWTDDDAGGLWRLGSDGKAAPRLPAQGPLASTEGLVAAPSGALLIGGGESGRIVVLRKDGRTSVLPLRIEKPEGMAFDAAGNLYIADNDADVLYLLTRAGRLHRAIANREGFSPETLHFADGALLITDSRNGKLHRYTPEDGLATVAVLAGALGNVQGVTSDERQHLPIGADRSQGAARHDHAPARRGRAMSRPAPRHPARPQTPPSGWWRCANLAGAACR